MLTNDTGILPTFISASISEQSSTIQDAPKPLIATLKTTFDCGVQTCLDNPEVREESTDDAIMKKRLKRKQYKKRKKEKIQTIEKENKQQFKQIIDLFYEKDAKFIDYENKLEELVCSFNQKQFKNMFDSILKERVLVIQNSIWEYTQTILFENPLQMSHDHEFYLNMVDYLYKYYQQIQKSSKQSQQVIYIFLALINSNSQQPITPQDLGRRTFRYLIQTDETLRKLLHMCDKKISYIRGNTRIKLETLVSKLRNFRERFNEDDQQEYQNQSDSQNEDEQSSFNNYEDQKSTTISEQSDEFQQSNNKNKRRRKKLKQSEIENSLQIIFARMQKLTIHDNHRQECRLENDWLSKMSQRGQKLSIRNRKQQSQFEKLYKKLQKIKPCKIVDEQFKGRYLFQE